MALNPKKFDVYHLSEINRAEEFQNGKRVFRGYGGDGSGISGDIIYFMSVPLARLVSFKAFITELKFNISKENEIVNSSVSDEPLFIEHSSDLEIDLSIDIPATTVNEAVNNVAKIEELQRLILPVDSKYVSPIGNTIAPLFKVLYKNLISQGKPFKSMYFPNELSYKFMLENGFQCLITDVSYEPDFSSGFFEFADTKWAKNIKLKLKLMYESEISPKFEMSFSKAITGFEPYGKYNDIDNGCFPFGLVVKNSSNLEEGFMIDNLKTDFTTLQINDFKNKQGNSTINALDSRRGNYLFFSIDISGDEGEKQTNLDSKRQRYVVFKSFLENFNRKVETNLVEIEDKGRDIGKKINLQAPVTYKSLSYNVKLIVPSEDLVEAKKNCAKIQYLIRMFYKQANSEEFAVALAASKKSKSATDLFSVSSRNIKVYCPGFIEKPNASRSPANHLNFKAMFDNSVSAFFSNLNFDVNIETGFFKDSDGSIYPKEMSVDLEFHVKPKNYMSSYKYSPLTDKYKMIGIQEVKGFEHLFPLNRKTVKLG